MASQLCCTLTALYIGVGQASGAYSAFPDDIRVPYQKRRFVGIPDGLFHYYDSESSLKG